MSSYYAHSLQFCILGSFCHDTVQKSPVHIYKLIKKNRSFDGSIFRHTEIYLKLRETHRICSDSLFLINSLVNAVERTPKVFVQVSNRISIVRNCNKLPTIPPINFVLCKLNFVLISLEISKSTFRSLHFSSLLVPSLVILFFFPRIQQENFGTRAENVCQHSAARRATNWRAQSNEVSIAKGLNRFLLCIASVAECKFKERSFAFV